MRNAALALLALVSLLAVELAWGNQEPQPKTDDKPASKEKKETPSVLLEKPQEVTLELFNGKSRTAYLIKLTPETFSYKQFATGTEITHYSAKDGAILEVRTARGGKFTLNKTTNLFEVTVAEPPENAVVEKGKEVEFKIAPLEQAILDLTNEERKKEGLPPLKVNEKLFQIARSHSQNMAKQEKLDHVLDGKDPTHRAKEVGYGPFVAENCAWGQRTAAEVVRTWMNSPGHRANLLNKTATEVGIGYSVNQRSGAYYTMVFGFRRVQ